MAISTLVAVLALVPLLPLLTLGLIRIGLRIWGWSLQAKTRDRREAIRIQTARDLKVTQEKQSHSREVEDGWEKVEREGTAPNGQVPQDDWEGIIGFFHPFW
jgi:alpha-1,2-mannosyltransferase